MLLLLFFIFDVKLCKYFSYHSFFIFHKYVISCFLTNIYSIAQEQFELCDAYCTSTVVPFFIQLSVFRFLAKILIPEGSKDVPVGQPIAITVVWDYSLAMVALQTPTPTYEMEF